MANIRPRRSVLYMPGSNARALEKARSLKADALILDLEDAVAPEAKILAREQVCAAIRKGFGKREVVVRVNPLDSEWGHADVAAIAAAKPDAILIPKVSSPDHIAAVARELSPEDHSTALWAMIETPRGVVNLPAIAAAGEPLQALVLGTNDLIKELGATVMKDRANLLHVLGQIVLAARAFGLSVIDGVYNDISDADGFAFSCFQARQFGFDGKTVIHPNQIETCNLSFSPSMDEIDAAMRIVAAFSKPENLGKGAIKLDGRMVEKLHADAARRTLALAEAIAGL
ncbi:citrate lyase subunit beta/citryl-CoA lyase [Rhizomicrobium palustre]|uniref:Citrate lyase subunit beta/citryl-CoA lyase n=1 Tax=Rhizomicrobium palustre TaxID=189966 RepID=A0A846MXN6_9PROT|nr:CoA ester lyase [Rhizomicrobium palustre]NIK87901.1 citrate lyase subunit beta/citryl-CoA lyase [Rhizomicrobium palustre]